MTLSCEGRFYPAHKLVLATCSEFFEEVFQRTQCKHPFIVLKDITCHELESLLDYMYHGEVKVLQSNLTGLIKSAESLRIKGLAAPDEPPRVDTAVDSHLVTENNSENQSKKRSMNSDLSLRNKIFKSSHFEMNEFSNASDVVESSQKDLQNKSSFIPFDHQNSLERVIISSPKSIKSSSNSNVSSK